MINEVAQTYHKHIIESRRSRPSLYNHLVPTLL